MKAGRKKRKRPILSPPPSFMLDDGILGTEDIPLADVPWNGDDGKWSAEEQTNICLEIRPLDEAIELARVHGQHAANSDERRNAEVAVLSRREKRRGRRPVIDDYLLARIARKYKSSFYANSSQTVELDSIIFQVIDEERCAVNINQHSEGALIDRLRRKFNKNKNELIYTIELEHSEERGPAVNRARRQLAELEASGEKIDCSLLDPVLRGPYRRP